MDRVFQKPLISWGFHTQQSLEFIQNGAKNKKNIQRTTVLSVETPSWWERSEKNDLHKPRLVSSLSGYESLQIHILCIAAPWAVCMFYKLLWITSPKCSPAGFITPDVKNTLVWQCSFHDGITTVWLNDRRQHINWQLLWVSHLS